MWFEQPQLEAKRLEEEKVSRWENGGNDTVVWNMWRKQEDEEINEFRDSEKVKFVASFILEDTNLYLMQKAKE